MSDVSIPTFIFHVPLWKVIPHPDKPIIIVELRDLASRETTFSAIDISEQKLLWSQRNLHEPWWVGIIGIWSDIILAYGFENFENPQYKGIYAYDVFTGTPVWQQPELKFINFKNGVIEVKSMEDEWSVFALSIETGKKTFESKFQDVNNSNISYPSHLVEDNILYPKIARFIKDFLSEDVTGGLDYLEYQKSIIVSFHIKTIDTFENIIAVVDKQGNLLLKVVVEKQLQGLFKDTFFVYFHHLIFIKEKRNLITWKL